MFALCNSIPRLMLALAALAMAPNVLAHGSVSMDQDVCKLRVGKYIMHFTGYQPETASGPKEFCEDIPEAANTVIVLDYIHDELRDLPTEVRIIRDSKVGDSKGGESGSEQDLNAVTVFHLPPQRHPSGSLSLEAKLEEGNYIGLVTVGEIDKAVARFPFSVGKKRYFWHILLGLVLAGAVGLYYFGLRQRKRQRTAP